MRPWNGERSWWPLVATKSILSQRNGAFLLHKWFHRLEIFGGGMCQSGANTEKALRRLLALTPKDLPVRRVLVLGLGAGRGLKWIFRQFPDAHIIAIEDDETIIQLCTIWGLPGLPRERVEIILGDIEEKLESLSGTFDVILIDGFISAQVSSRVVLPRFRQTLKRLLAWRGAVLVNWFDQSDRLAPEFEQDFVVHQLVRVKENIAGIYRRHGMGKMGEPTPEGFQELDASTFARQALVCGSKHKQIVSINDQIFIRTQVGPCIVDQFCGQTEPQQTPSKGAIRFLVWQRYEVPTRQTWWTVPRLFSTQFLKGVAVVDSDQYFSVWEEHAKRKRRAFLKSEDWIIERVNLADFEKGYHQTKTLDSLTRRMFISLLRYHLAWYPQNVYLEVVKERKSGQIHAGLATVDYPDIRLSKHIISFVHPQSSPSSAGVGLIDHWYQRSWLGGIRFLNFGILHRPGIDPGSWRGYTAFKRQFHLLEIQLPKPAWKVVLPRRGS